MSQVRHGTTVFFFLFHFVIASLFTHRRLADGHYSSQPESICPLNMMSKQPMDAQYLDGQRWAVNEAFCFVLFLQMCVYCIEPRFGSYMCVVNVSVVV